MNESINPGELSIAQRFELPQFQKEAKFFFDDLKKTIRSKMRGKSKAVIEQAYKERVAALKYDWNFNARRKQRFPIEEYVLWVILSGRGFGKTRTGAEWIKHKEAQAKKAGKKIEIGLVGDIYSDIVDAQIKAIIECYDPNDKQNPPPEFVNDKLIWKSGTIAYPIQAEVPKKFRSKNLDCAWVDELAKFQYPEKVWDGLMFCTRMERNGPPQILVTTTPSIKAKKLLKKITDGEYGKCIVTRGNSYENTVLSDRYKDLILKPYVGTRLGQQEIEGQDIDDMVGALWNHSMIKYWNDFVEIIEAKAASKKVTLDDKWSDNYYFKEVIVAIDPATTAKLKSDETGIIVAARDYEDRGFILEDKSGKYSPNQWAEIAVNLYQKYRCKCIVAEKNQGGDMVSTIIHNCNDRIPVKLVHASKGKIIRAEPVARLYEKGMIFHKRTFHELEEQLCNYTGKQINKPDLEIEEFNRIDSPDRMDAMVWALTHLFPDMMNTSPKMHNIPESTLRMFNPFL